MLVSVDVVVRRAARPYRSGFGIGMNNEVDKAVYWAVVRHLVQKCPANRRVGTPTSPGLVQLNVRTLTPSQQSSRWKSVVETANATSSAVSVVISCKKSVQAWCFRPESSQS